MKVIFFCKRSVLFFTLLAFVSSSSFSQVCNLSSLPSNLRNGLVAFYPFCGNANDVSGNNNSLQSYGLTSTTDRFGIASSAYSFSNTQTSVTSYLKATNPTPFATSNYTISAWFNSSQFYPNISGVTYNYQSIVYYSPQWYQYGPAYHLALQHANNSILEGGNWTAANAGQNITTTNGSISVNQWYHAVLTYDGTTIKMYLNGSLIGSAAASLSYANQVQFLIGGAGDGPSPGGLYGGFNGKLDDIGFWSRPLCAAEVSQLYTQTSTNIPVSSFSINPFSDTTKVCGTSTTLNAGTGYSTYSWNTGATTQSFSATSSGFYKVTVTNSAGCTSSDSTYLSLVNATITNNDTLICRGSTVQLSVDTLLSAFRNRFTYLASAQGKKFYVSNNLVTWFQARDSAIWFNGRLAALNTVQKDTLVSNLLKRMSQGNVFPLTSNSGSAWIGLMQNAQSPSFSEPGGGWEWISGDPFSYSNWASSEPNNNSVQSEYGETNWNSNSGKWNDRAPGTIGDGTIRYVFETNDNGPLSILWSTGATTSTINVSPTQTTKYYVDVSDGINTCRDSITITVSDISTFNPFSDTTRVCGTSTVLNAGSGYATYSWNTGATTQNITASTGGFYKVTVTNAVGCTVSDSTTLSLVNANISNNDTTICLGNSIRLSIDSTFPNRTACSVEQLPTSMQNSLIAYYPFCGNANNALGTGNNGTVYNATLTTDRFGNTSSAYTFNGTNAYIDFGSNTSIGPTSTIPISISLWVSGGASGNVISKYTNLDASRSYFLFGRSANGYSWIGNGTNPYINNTGVADNTWTHYVLIGVAGTNNSKVYRNGTLIATGTLAMNATMQAVSLLVGKVGASSPGFLNGKVDDIFIYNRALSLSEIQNLYLYQPTVAWSTGATTNSIVVTPTQTATYYVDISDGIGTCRDSVTVTVSVPPTSGTLSGANAICIGGTTTFASTVTGGSWTSSNTGVATINTTTGVITGIAAGTATMTYTVTGTGGCANATATRVVTIAAANTAGAASSMPTLCINTALINITHTTTGATGIGTATGLPTGVTAAWASNRITISGTPTQSGTYNYSIPLTGGCGSVNATGTITVTAANTAGAASSTPTLCINTALTNITHATTGATGIGTATGLPAGVTAAWASNRITISGTPTQSGTYNYSIPLTGGCGNINATGTITVTARPVAGTLDGTQEICVLGSTTFSSTVSGGVWSSSASTLATVDATSGLVTGIAAGTAIITYTMTGTGGCSDVSATRTVTVTAPPTAGVLSGTQDICIAGTTTLSSTISGGTWSSSTVTVATIDATTGAVAGIAAGTSTMTYTVTGTGGCSDVSATRIVTVTTPPSAGLLSGPQDICIAGTTPLASTVSGGTWSSSAVSVATINATSGVATGVAAGIATMTYTVAGTGGCAIATATRLVTVTAAPSAGTLSGTQAICVSSSVLFNSTSPGGSWSSSNSLIATIDATTGSVSGIAPGTAIMTYVVPGTGGCANTSATRTVTVTAAPNAGTLSGTQAICIAGTSSFSSSVTGGTWSSSATSIAAINSTSGLVTGLTAGTATITYTVIGTGGCVNATATRTVTVTAASVAGTLSGTQAICIAGTSTLTSSITGGTWTTSNGSIATINSSSGFVTGVAAGTATMTYTIVGTGGCADATATRTVTVTTPPVAGPLSGVQAICVAGTSSFNSSINGGSWASSDNTIATINNTTGFITGVAAGTATMTYTIVGTGGCADATATRTVTVTTPPVAGTLSGGASICITGTTVFSSTISGGTWTSSNNSIALINATTGVVTGVDVGTSIMTYTITGTGGCANVSATRNVTVNPNNTVTAPSSLPTLCINTLLTPITHTTTGATGIGTASGLPLGVSALWLSNSISISGTPQQSGTFNYSIPLSGGCGRDSAVGVIIVRPDNIVSAPSSTPTVCINSSLTPITFTTTGATGIGTATGLPAGVVATWFSNIITVNGTPTQSGTFTYSVPLTGGCGTINASGVIIVAPLPTGTITSSTNLLCEGGNVQLTATGGNTYQWFINGGAIVGATNATHAATQPGTYTVNLISSNNCIAPSAGSVALQLVQKPIVNFSYNKYCAGFPTQFSDQSNTANSNVVTYNWSFGTGQGTSTLQNPNYIFPTASTYSVSLVVTPVPCPSLAASITKSITTVAPPANQRYTSLNAVENRDLQLTSRTFSGSSYSWSPSTGLSSTTIYNPVFNYNTEVDYVITITTGIGCVIKDTQLVRIFKEKEIYVPKGFSPNGDNNNDKIFPRLVGVRSLTYFKVFNRWGKLLFQTSNLNEGWDGTFRGTKQPMETYVWTAEGIDIDNNSIKRTGTFLLVR